MAYETLQIDRFISFFDPMQFRAYPALEENMRNALQDLSSMRVYLRIDNRQVSGDFAAYQAAFEITFSTKSVPNQFQQRTENITMRLQLDRRREDETWRIVDYSSDLASNASRIVTIGTGTGSEVFGLSGGAGSPDFALALSASSLDLPVGGSGMVDVTVTPQNGFNQAVNITVEGLPAGVSASPLSLSGSTGHLVITAGANAVPQSATVDVVGTDLSGQIRHTVSLRLSLLGGFELSSSTTLLLLQPGGTATVQVTVLGLQGFSGNVAISVDPLPSGVSINPAQATVAAGSSVSFLISALATATPGQSSLIIRGQAGGAEKTLVIPLLIPAPDFDLVSSAPIPLVLAQGGSVAVPVTVVGHGDFAGNVTLSIDPLPSGISVDPVNVSVPVGNTTTFLLSASPSATTGAFQVTVRGRVGQVEKTLVLSLLVEVTPNFDLIVNPATSSTSPLNLIVGDSASFSVTVQPINNFEGSVDVSFDPVSGLTIDPPSAALSPGSSATFRLLASSQINLQTSQLTIRGRSGTAERTATVFLRIQGFQLVITPATSSGSPLNLAAGGQASFTVQLQSVNGFTGAADITVQPPAGISANVSSTTLNAGGSFGLVLTAVSASGAQETVVRAQRGSFQTSASVFLNIAAAAIDFSFGAISPSTSATYPLEVAPGTSFSLTIDFTRATGFTGPVTFDFSTATAGITLDPSSIVVPDPQTQVRVNVTLASSMTFGPAQILITASGSPSQTSVVYLRVVDPFVLSLGPTVTTSNLILVTPGQDTLMTVTAHRQGGFTGDIVLDISSSSSDLQLLGGPICEVSCPFVVTLGPNQETFTFTAHAVTLPSASLPENILLTVNASGDSLVRERRVAFRLVAGSGPSLFVVGAGSSASSPLNITEGCASTSPGPTSTLTVNATGTGSIFVNCGSTGLSGLSGSFGSGCTPLTAGGANCTCDLTSTTVPSLGAGSFTLTGYADSDFVTPISAVTVYVNLLGGICAQPPPGDTLAGSGAVKAKFDSSADPSKSATGSHNAGGKTIIAVDIDRTARSGAPTILAVQPSRAAAGQEIQAVIVGQNLATASAVRSSADGIASVMAGPGADQRLVVTLRVSEQAIPGTYLLVVDGAGGSATVPFTVLPSPHAAREVEGTALSRNEPKAESRSRLPRESEQAADRVTTPALPDLVVSRDEISVSPAMPRAGDRVTFRVPVHNIGSAAAQDVVVEFSIPDANLTAREIVTLAPGRSETLLFEWPAARASTGRGLEPRVVLDPDNRIVETTKQNNSVRLLPLMIEGGSMSGSNAAGVPATFQASSATPSLRREDRAKVELALGECASLRLQGGVTTACGSFGDLELRLANDGATLAFAADAVRALAVATLEQVTSVEEGVGARELPVEVGRVYAVTSRGHVAAVRVRSVRGLEQARAERAARPPAAIDSPRLARSSEADRGDFRSRLPIERRVQVELEWVVLPGLR